LDDEGHKVASIGTVERTMAFPDRDLVRLDFNRVRMQPFPSIKAKLRKKGNYYEGPVSRVVRRVTIKGGKHEVHYAYYSGKRAELMKTPHPMIFRDSKGEEVRSIVKEYYRVSGCTGLSGDCGYPYIANEEGSHYILGIHLGAVSQDTFCSPIWLEDLDEYGLMDVRQTPGFLQFSADPAVFEPMLLPDGSTSIHRAFTKPGLNLAKRTKRQEFLPTESTFSPSVFYEELSEKNLVETGPTRLTFFRDEEGKWVDPHQNGFDKFGERLWPESNELFEFLEEKPSRAFKDFVVLDERPEPWTMKQAMEAAENSDSMPRDASITLEFRGKINDRGKPIKSRFDLWELDAQGKLSWCDSQLEEQVATLQEWAADPEVTLNCSATICPKDELTTLEKVNNGATRLFMVAVLVLCILTKMYLGPIMSKMKRHLVGQACSVGINPLGAQWGHLFNYVNQIEGANYMAADCKGWDRSVLYFWTHLFHLWLCECYSVLPTSRLGTILRNIAASIVGVSFVYMNGIYVINRGVSSGHYATSLFNTFVNYCIHRGLFNFLKRKQGCALKWRDHVRFVFYGDDNFGKVSPQVSWFNMLTLSNAFKKYCGMSYTTSSKSAVVMPFMQMGEIEFLCRGFSVFSYMDFQYVLAPLNKASIYGMLAWLRKPTGENTYETQLLQNLDTAFREMFMHGKEEYDQFVALIQELCRKKQITGIKIKPWRMWMQRYIAGELSPSVIRAVGENACTESGQGSGARSL
jgi:hypothetical protein